MVLRSIMGKIGWGNPVWPSTSRPCTISMRRRRCAGAFIFGDGGAGRADQARLRVRRDVNALPCWSTSALAVTSQGRCGVLSQGQGCSLFSVS
jgi:hypothetical protein